jgi:anti-repressor protein
MTDLIPFDYSGRQIRTVTVDGEPWFVGRDVCAVLDIADPRASLNLLDEDERDSIPVTDSMGRDQQTMVINEPGLYSLILRSRKPEAKQFKRWVTHEVLPAIRKSGQFSVEKVGRRELALAILAAEDRADAAERRVAELEPKAAAVDAYMDASEVFLVSEVAKTLKVQEKKLRQHCYDRRILMAHPARRNEPYAQYVTAGYFEIKSRPVEVRGEPRAFNTTYVTTAGVEFLRRSLTRAGLIGDGPRLTVVRADGA